VVNFLTRAVVALGAAGMLGLSVGAAPAEAATSSGWRLTEVFGTGANNIDPLYPAGLATASSDSAWAVFYGCNWPCSASPTATVEHWNGHTWAPVPAGQLDGIEPVVVAASSARDAWLFGAFPGMRYPGAQHWNGTSWSKPAVPSWVIRINGSGDYDVYPADFGPRNLWLFSLGGYVGIKTAFAAHYLNGRWTKSYLPDIPQSAAAVSGNDIWVIGQPFSGTGPAVLMHWNGHRWTTEDLPKQRVAGSPVDLVAAGPHSLWLGWSPVKAGATGYLLHWTGARWSKVTFPPGASGFPAAPDGSGGVWLSGIAAGPKQVQLFMHWSAGKWKIFHVPNGHYMPGNVDELALIPGTRSVWATGNVYGPGAGTTLNRGTIWRYDP
jgi:hypothetical protein